jgi:hypothetical protein
MQNITYILPRPVHLAHQGAMPAIGIAVQSSQVRNHSGPQGVQVDIANQFQKISIFLADNGFISVLEQMPMAPVPAVETDGIAG